MRPYLIMPAAIDPRRKYLLHIVDPVHYVFFDGYREVYRNAGAFRYSLRFSSVQVEDLNRFLGRYHDSRNRVDFVRWSVYLVWIVAETSIGICTDLKKYESETILLFNLAENIIIYRTRMIYWAFDSSQLKLIFVYVLSDFHLYLVCDKRSKLRTSRDVVDLIHLHKQKVS